MKSRLFKLFFENRESDAGKAFERHLKEFLSLGEEVRTECLAELPKLLRPTTEYQSRQIVETVVQTCQIDQQAVEHAFSVLKFFVKALLSEDVPKDDHKNWAEDLVSLSDINDSERSAFEATIQNLVQRRSDLRIQDKTERARAGVLPCFTSMGVTVEARAVKEDRYRWGTPIDEYKPQIIGLTYVASVHIGVDVGLPEDFFFQLSQADLDDMINTLVATKKEIAAIKSRIGDLNDGNS